MMEKDEPRISVVIPTFDRLPRLRLVLEALAKQSLGRDQFEVIVISDGSSDGTHEYLDNEAPLALRWAAQPNSGPAVARNHGVSLARGTYVHFIDDDVVAAPDLIERHLAGHGDSLSTIVIGPMLNAPDYSYSPWVAWEQTMLYKQYEALRVGRFQANARQFYTGNASMPRELFHRVGGFDASYRRAEDIEMAYRLDQLGVTFVFDEQAIGYHHASRSFDSWIAAAAAYGRNDVLFSRRHDQPWMLDALCSDFCSRHVMLRGITRVALRVPPMHRPLTFALRSAALGLARLGLQKPTRYSLSGLYGLGYYRGAAEELGGARTLLKMIADHTKGAKA